MPTTDLMIEALVAMRNDPEGVSPEHFWQLVERFRADLVNQAFAILGRQADAEDVAQESLCQAFQGLAQLRDPAALGRWMRSINRHNALRVVRRRRRQEQREGRLATGANPAVEGSGAPGEPGQQRLERVARAIDALPEEYRTVLVFRYWEDLSYEEIARCLGVPLGTVNSRMARAYRLLCERLKPLLPSSTLPAEGRTSSTPRSQPADPARCSGGPNG